jgi:predicted transglutaminase-like cysteine proteinase
MLKGCFGSAVLHVSLMTSRFAGARGLGAACLIAFGLFAGAPAQAQTLAALPPVGNVVQSSGSARPVAAWNKFCERFPKECAVDTREAAVVTLTPQLWQLITAVNRKVNREIRPMTDKDHWGVVDSWDFPTDGIGDCEDYQLLKRRLLVERGLPRRALRMTVVIDELNEGHAVLMVRTDRGDFVLDNKTNAVLPWQQTGYVYVKREGHDSATWVSLGGVTTQPVTTANYE